MSIKKEAIKAEARRLYDDAVDAMRHEEMGTPDTHPLVFTSVLQSTLCCHYDDGEEYDAVVGEIARICNENHPEQIAFILHDLGLTGIPEPEDQPEEEDQPDESNPLGFQREDAVECLKLASSFAKYALAHLKPGLASRAVMELAVSMAPDAPMYEADDPAHIPQSVTDTLMKILSELYEADILELCHKGE